MTEKNLLEELHKEVTKSLLKKIKDGTATSADISAATKFLKDNGVIIEIKRDKDPMSLLLEAVAIEETTKKPFMITKKKNEDEDEEKLNSLIEKLNIEEIARGIK